MPLYFEFYFDASPLESAIIAGRTGRRSKKCYRSPPFQLPLSSIIALHAIFLALRPYMTADFASYAEPAHDIFLLHAGLPRLISLAAKYFRRAPCRQPPSQHARSRMTYSYALGALHSPEGRARRL